MARQLGLPSGDHSGVKSTSELALPPELAEQDLLTGASL
jgi:hypothetical protein